MRRNLATLFTGVGLFGMTVLTSVPVQAQNVRATAPVEKDWTLLVYLNGHNNLDRFGAININQMEEVGSTDRLNVVVQWASQRGGNTKRLLVQKDFKPSQVTSPIVQDMRRKVDMGDPKSLVDFVRWAHENYPAKHYMLDIWNHGSGWHRYQVKNSEGGFQPMDISWDDNTGHHITTEQLGKSLADIATVIGHKVDIYGSDACLMAMAEVASEMAKSVQVFAGSQEVEPGAGWPYNTFLKRWAAQPDADAAQVSKFLAEEYLASYSGGENGTQSVTFSSYDLNHLDALNAAVTELGNSLMKLTPLEKSRAINAIRDTQNFTYDEYGDFGHFVVNMRKEGLLNAGSQRSIEKAMDQFVITNQVSQAYHSATGVSIWLPASANAYNSYSTRYAGLEFAKATGWNKALSSLLK